MANKKNQHFLPQYFFKNFSTNKKTINLILRKSGKIIKNASIKNQCSKSYFYGAGDIENLFAVLEGDQSKILRKIIQIDSFESWQRYKNDFDPVKHKDIGINPEMLALLQIILFQRSRTEFAAKQMSTSFSKMAKEIFISHLKAKEETEILKYIDFVDISVDEKDTVLMLIKSAFEFTPAILDLGIYILKNITSREFIFSDSPVVFYNRAYKDIKKHGCLGLQSPGLLIIFPISPNTCLLLVDEKKYYGDLIGKGYFEIKNEFDIDSLNKLQLHHSLNSIYCSDNLSEQYIKKIWKQQKNSFVDLFGRFQNLDSVDQYGKKNGEILHMYEEQIPFEMNLSFLKSVDLSNERIIPNHRNKELIEIMEEMKNINKSKDID